MWGKLNGLDDRDSIALRIDKPKVGGAAIFGDAKLVGFEARKIVLFQLDPFFSERFSGHFQIGHGEVQGGMLGCAAAAFINHEARVFTCFEDNKAETFICGRLESENIGVKGEGTVQIFRGEHGHHGCIT